MRDRNSGSAEFRAREALEPAILIEGSSEDFLNSIIPAIALVLSTLFSFSYSKAQTVPVQDLDITRYAPGTHFSVIYDSKNPNRVWAAPGEGATLADGSPAPQTVIRNGGHTQMRDAVRAELPFLERSSTNFSGGGFTLGQDNQISFSYTSRGVNGKENPVLHPFDQAILRKALTENIGKNLNGKAINLLPSAECVKLASSGLMNVVAITSILVQAVHSAQLAEDLKQFAIGGCPTSPARRFDSFWNRLYTEPDSKIANRLSACSPSEKSALDFALEAHRLRVLTKLRQSFGDGSHVDCSNPKSISVTSSNGEKFSLALQDASIGSISADENSDHAVILFAGKDGARSVRYSIGKSTWTDPVSSFEQRAICQTDVSTCEADTKLLIWDDQLGVDVRHPFGLYYDGSATSATYLKSKSLFLAAQALRFSDHPDLCEGLQKVFADR